MQCSKQFSMTVDAVSSCIITTASPLPDATAYQTYSEFLAASNGIAPYTWQLIAGTIPGGGTLSAAGEVEISPAPNTTETQSFTVEATDSTPGTPKTCTKEFELEIAPATDCPNWSNMSWGNGNLPIITFTPSSTTGNAFTCTITAPALSSGSTSQDGVIAYAGAGCSNCRIAFSMSASGGANIQVNLKFSGITAFSWDSTVDSNVDQSFSVHPAYVSVGIEIIASVVGVAGGNASLTGLIENT